MKVFIYQNSNRIDLIYMLHDGIIPAVQFLLIKVVKNDQRRKTETDSQ